MKYVACYCRVSTEEQVKYGFSIQAQKDALEKYCKDNNYKYEFYIDEGISASSMKKRKALQEMLEKCNVFDMILFTKLDRLSRNVLDANNINKILQDNKCTMKAIDEDDVDTSTADGMFMFNLKVSLAQREIGKTSERINFVFKNKRKNGEVTSGQKKYGYDIVNKKFIINQAEAQNIVNLYKYFVSVNGDLQLTYKYFIKYFKGKGQDAMRNYLNDTAYIGKYKLYRKSIYLDNYIPRIISEDLWNDVQRLKSRKTITKKTSSKATIDIFSGLIYCSKCGSRIHKKVDNRVKKRTVRYVCDKTYNYIPGKDIKKCDNNKSIREDTIEEYLLNNLITAFNKYKLKNSEIETFVKTESNTKKIRNIEHKINKIKDLYLDDLIDKETYKKDYDKFSKELNNLKAKKSITIKKDFSYIEQILNTDYKSIYNKLTIENKKKFWLSILDKIYVLDGKIKEIIFR